MSFGFKEILVIAIIVIVIFGTKKLRNLGSDLGASVKGFKDAMNEGEADSNDKNTAEQQEQVQQKSEDNKNA